MDALVETVGEMNHPFPQSADIDTSNVASRRREGGSPADIRPMREGGPMLLSEVPTDEAP